MKNSKCNVFGITENMVETGEYETVNAYTSSLEHLVDELKRLDLILRLCIQENTQKSSINPYTGVLSASEIESLLNDGNSIGQDKSQIADKLVQLDKQICKRLKASKLNGIHLSIPYISRLLNLSTFEERCIIACLAPEMNQKYGKIYGYLQDDTTVKSPSIDLLLKIFILKEDERIIARKVFDIQAPMVRFLMELQNDLTDSRVPLIARHLKLDDWVVNYLVDVHVLDSRLAHVAEMVTSEGQWKDSTLTVLKDRIVQFINYYRNSKGNKLGQIFYFYGPYGVGKKDHVLAVCDSLDLPLIIADVEKLLTSEGYFDELLRLLGRQVMIGNAVLCLENFNNLMAEERSQQQKTNRLLYMLQTCAPITFILGRSQWNPSNSDNKSTFIGVEFPYPTESERRTYWGESSRKYKVAETVNLDNFSENFQFTPAQIETALKLGENISVWNGAADGLIGAEELNNSCYAQSSRKLSTLATKIKAMYTMEMLVLPEDQTSQMQEIFNQVKYRSVVYEKWGFEKRLALGKGLNILFSGPPGSGKTMAAEVIANEIGLEIYKIDVSQVVSKYIGDTEKNLSEIFLEAETSNAILFFDEADALFGKRSEVKDAHDRYANIEIGYLLQRIEEYKGIVILATNLNQNIDEAFLRRLHFNVAFPFPDKEQRMRIWHGIFPPEAPLVNDMDFDFLAEKFILAGGNIKNIALNAAFYAAHASCPIGIKQIMLAAKREYKKLGKTFLMSDFTPYYQLIEVMK